jgi:hypothetical protein
MLYVNNPLAAWALGETVVARVFGEYCGVQEVLKGFAGHAIREIGSEPFGVSAGALPRTHGQGCRRAFCETFSRTEGTAEAADASPALSEGEPPQQAAPVAPSEESR